MGIVCLNATYASQIVYLFKYNVLRFHYTYILFVCVSFRYEDPAALDGGEDGLNVIKQILTLAPLILLNQG